MKGIANIFTPNNINGYLCIFQTTVVFMLECPFNILEYGCEDVEAPDILQKEHCLKLSYVVEGNTISTRCPSNCACCKSGAATTTSKSVHLIHDPFIIMRINPWPPNYWCCHGGSYSFIFFLSKFVPSIYGYFHTKPNPPNPHPSHI